MRDSDSPPVWFGLAFLVAGLFVLGIALGVVPVDPASVHAPMWVLAACGMVFALGGVAVLTPEHSRLRSAAGGTIVLAMGLIGAWVALWGGSEHFSGGVPFVSPEANVLVARVVFGMGALMCFAMLAWGVRQIARGRLTEETD